MQQSFNLEQSNFSIQMMKDTKTTVSQQGSNPFALLELRSLGIFVLFVTPQFAQLYNE